MKICTKNGNFHHNFCALLTHELVTLVASTIN